MDWFTGAVFAGSWAIGWVLCWRLPRLPDAARPTPGELVSVIIPARNEAENLPRLLDGLERQVPCATEVIVVDDHSTDETAALASGRANTRVLPAPPLPDGWTGKAWACWQGSRTATGDVLVFLDADTDPSPDLLVRVAAEVSGRGGLVSVMPYHQMKRAYERLSAFFSLISLMGIGAASAWRDARVTGAFGPCLACTRRDYDASGGHEAVRAAVVDDVALAQRFGTLGLPVSVAGGRGAIRYRLYGGGLHDLVEGWSKNFASGAGSTPRLRLLLVFAWIVGIGTAAQAPVREALALLAGWDSPGLLWVGYVAFTVQLALMLRPLGNYRWAAPLFPVPLLAWFVIFCRSLIMAIRGEVRWKDRIVQVRR